MNVPNGMSLYDTIYAKNEEGIIVGNIIIMDLKEQTYTIEFTKEDIIFDKKIKIGDRMKISIETGKIVE